MKTFLARFFTDTPTFFKRVKAIGITLAAIGAAIVAPPLAGMLPAVFTTVAGYLITAGTVAAAVSQAVQPSPPDTAVDNNDLKKDQVTVDPKQTKLPL